MHDYAHIRGDAAAFGKMLEPLIELRGHRQVEAWQAHARAGRWPELFLSLMHEHYDPLYERSLRRGFAGIDDAPVIELADGEEPALRAAGSQLMRASAAESALNESRRRPGDA